MAVIRLPRDPNHEFVKFYTFATVEKRTEDYDDYIEEMVKKGVPDYEAVMKATADIKPYETVVGDYNAMVDNGIDLCLALLVGGGGTSFVTGNARLGVGASTTAWNTTQADLITTSTRKAMKSGSYPQTSSKKITFCSDFLTGEANIAWNEWGIFNSASGVTMLSRKVESLGTKSSGTWTLTVDFSVS